MVLFYIFCLFFYLFIAGLSKKMYDVAFPYRNSYDSGVPSTLFAILWVITLPFFIGWSIVKSAANKKEKQRIKNFVAEKNANPPLKLATLSGQEVKFNGKKVRVMCYEYDYDRKDYMITLEYPDENVMEDTDFNYFNSMLRKRK